jgi:orotidine-5'-phosphate decarboxylase
VVGSYGTSYLTVHAGGGAAMVRAGVEGLAEGAAGAGVAVPTALAVTVLTSEVDAPPSLLAARVAAGLEGGCGGFVCAATDVALVRAQAPDAALVVPGIRLDGPTHDQARVGRPEAALAAGADLLVIGRAVTAAADPRAAAEAVAAAVAAGGGPAGAASGAVAGAAGAAQGAGPTSVR